MVQVVRPIHFLVTTAVEFWKLHAGLIEKDPQLPVGDPNDANTTLLNSVPGTAAKVRLVYSGATPHTAEVGGRRSLIDNIDLEKKVN